MGRVAVDLILRTNWLSRWKIRILFVNIWVDAREILPLVVRRLGLHSAMFSCVGTDAMGQFLKQELQRESVDITLVQETGKHLTGLVFLALILPTAFP